MSFDTLSLSSSLVISTSLFQLGCRTCRRRLEPALQRFRLQVQRNLEERNPRGVRKSTSFVLSSVVATCIRYPGFFALRALKSFDRIVFLEIALYSMCTILDIVKLKKLQKRNGRVFNLAKQSNFSVHKCYFYLRQDGHNYHNSLF